MWIHIKWNEMFAVLGGGTCFLDYILRTHTRMFTYILFSNDKKDFLYVSHSYAMKNQ